MFGYIKPYVPELKVRDNELYGAVYCGLCKSMGRSIRRASRMALSYDAVFLALVLSSLSGKPFELYKGKCGLNPFRKKLLAADCDILRYSAAASAQLTYYSVLDKIRDERGFKKLGAKMILPSCRKAKEKAKKIYGFDDKIPKLLLEKLHGYEESKCGSLDMTACCFGELLSYYFRCGAPENKADSAAVIGDMTGRFIYAADACDDLEKDMKSGSYNPLIYGEESKETKLHGAYGAMCIWADTAAGELMLEGVPGHSFDTADNIMRLGMADTAKKLTAKDTGRKKHGKRSI